MKKVIAFDLDGTLAPSKSRLPEQMSGLMSQLLEQYQVCVISGGRIEQFHKQLLDDLKATPAELARLHLMPTCGTRYYEYDASKNDWNKVYAEDFTAEEKQKIAAALNKGFDDLGYREQKVYGDTVEDRGSQVTFSVLGQTIVDDLGEEGLRLKHEWDPDDRKKVELRDYIAPLVPEFEVRVGGITSIDVTKKGIDKAYGMRKLTEILGVTSDEILFIGDRIVEGGNDYPVKQAGIDTIAVASWQQTALVVQAILAVSK